MVRMNRDLAQAVVIRETAKELLCPELGTKYKALSADASTAFGLSSGAHDFRRARPSPRSALVAVRGAGNRDRRASGAADASSSRTQAPTDADLLSILIDDALAGHDPRTVVKLYTAPTELDPFAESTIRLANPAFDAFMNRSRSSRDGGRRQADAGARGGIPQSDSQPADRNQQSVHRARGMVRLRRSGRFARRRAAVWRARSFSSTTDLTALVLIGWRDGKWRVQPTFWLPSEGLSDKAVADRVPYDLWHGQGFPAGDAGQDRFL